MLLPASLAAAEGNGAMGWGNNTWGQLGIGMQRVPYQGRPSFYMSAFAPRLIGELGGVASVATGATATLARLENGSVLSWGANDQGQLGLGQNTGPTACEVPGSEETEPCALSPQAVPGLSDVVSIASGGEHSLALLADGTVMAWGSNSSGQLGVGTATGPEACVTRYENFAPLPCSRTPVPVPGLTGVAAIAAGENDSFALLENGTVVAWGSDELGELGVGANAIVECGPRALRSCQPTPTAVSGLSGVKQIAAGANDTLALLSNGTVRSWGYGALGELGNGGQETSYQPVEVQGVTGAISVGAGDGDNTALLANGTVMAWGGNYFGQLGDGTDTGPEICTVNTPETPCDTVPAPVTGLSGVTAVATGREHSLALLENGTVMAWGEGNGGSLGYGELPGPELCEVGPASSGTECSTAPIPVSGLDDVTTIAVSAGAGDSFALGPLVPGVSELETEGSAAAAARPQAEMAALAGGAGRSGSELGGTRVAVKGTDLNGATAVSFGGREAQSIKVEGNDRITAISPPGEGTVQVTVRTPQGQSATSSATTFTYAPQGPPSVHAVSPSEGLQAGGSTVTISGSELHAATAVMFGSNPAASFTRNADGTITAVSPAGSGTVDVTVTTPVGTSTTSSSDHFTYFAPVIPAITTVSPTKSPAAGGATITINGSGFVRVTSVRFGSFPAVSYTVSSTKRIVATTPQGTAGSEPITVTTEGGSATKTFKYANPTVTQITPAHGPHAGGQTVTILGTGFALGNGTVFAFSTRLATSVSCSSTTSCTAVTPAAPKAVPVLVTARAGGLRSTNATSRLFEYE